MLTNKDDWSKDQSVFLQVREIIAKIESRNIDREKDIEDFNNLNQLQEKKKWPTFIKNIYRFLVSNFFVIRIKRVKVSLDFWNLNNLLITIEIKSKKRLTQSEKRFKNWSNNGKSSFFKIIIKQKSTRFIIINKAYKEV